MKIASFACVLALAVAAFSTGAAEAAEGKSSAKSKPLRVTVTRSGRRIGGYSYKKSESMSVQRTLRFTNPPRQTPNGPFDSGFFFDTPTSPYGGSAPYMQ